MLQKYSGLILPVEKLKLQPIYGFECLQNINIKGQRRFEFSACGRNTNAAKARVTAQLC
jgi:hypothetical protein